MNITPKFKIPAPWDKILPWTSGVLAVISVGGLCYSFCVFNIFISFLKTLNPKVGLDLFILMSMFPLALVIGIFFLAVITGLVVGLWRVFFWAWTLITGTLFVVIGLKRGVIYIEKESIKEIKPDV
jgi:hypothetical protein